MRERGDEGGAIPRQDTGAVKVDLSELTGFGSKLNLERWTDQLGTENRYDRSAGKQQACFVPNLSTDVDLNWKAVLANKQVFSENYKQKRQPKAFTSFLSSVLFPQGIILILTSCL